jgi:hypothetical protein
MKKRIVVFTIVAAAAMTFTAGAEAHHRKVLCGNFGGYPPSARLAHKPARCSFYYVNNSVKLRSMWWTRWGGFAKGRGKVDGKQRTVRLKRGRPCGPFTVYSRFKIGDGGWHRMLHCGD